MYSFTTLYPVIGNFEYIYREKIDFLSKGQIFKDVIRSKFTY
jgi:hypothetical protein